MEGCGFQRVVIFRNKELNPMLFKIEENVNTLILFLGAGS
jgi:hypothetical protein